MSSAKDLVIVGAGGLAREVALLVEDINQVRAEWNLLGFIDKLPSATGRKSGSWEIVGDDSYFAAHQQPLHVVIAIGMPKVIAQIATQLRRYSHLTFPNLLHPSTVWRREQVHFGEGNIVLAGVSFTTDIDLQSFNVINPMCSIAHDSRIGSCNLISPGVNISGSVVIGDECMIGTGAKIVQGTIIHDRSQVGAGAVVLRNVEAGSTVVGVPAKPLQKE